MLTDCLSTKFEHAVSSSEEVNALGAQWCDAKTASNEIDISKAGSNTQLYHMIGQYWLGTVALLALIEFALFDALHYFCWEKNR